MNKKALRQKKKKLRQSVDREWIGYHVYRSTNQSLPFALWERLTDEPIPDGEFDGLFGKPETAVRSRFTRSLPALSPAAVAL